MGVTRSASATTVNISKAAARFATGRRFLNTEPGVEDMCRWFMSRMSYLGTCLVLGTLPNAASGQDPVDTPPPAFLIMSPSEEQELVGPLPWLDVQLSIPTAGVAKVELRRVTEDGAGEIRSVIVRDPLHPIARFQVDGATVVPGTYIAYLFPSETSNLIVDSVRFHVVKSDDPQEFPTITSPCEGAVFLIPPGGSIRVDIGGIAGGAFYLFVDQGDRPWASQRVEWDDPSVFRYSLPVELGEGDYRVRAFRADPTRIVTLPSDETTFSVIVDPSIEPAVTEIEQDPETPSPGNGEAVGTPETEPIRVR